MTVFDISIYFISQEEKNMEFEYTHTYAHAYYFYKYMDCVRVLSTLRKSTHDFMTPNGIHSVQNRHLIYMMN